MTWFLVIAVMVVGLALSAFYSGVETGIYRASRLRLHLGSKGMDSKARRLNAVLEDEPAALSVTLIGTNLMNYITTIACTFMFVDMLGYSGIKAELYTVAFLTPIVFVFGEIVPKTLFLRHADVLMLRGSWLLAVSSRLFRLTGVLWCFSRLAAAAERVTGVAPASDDASTGSSDLSPRLQGSMQATITPRRRVAIMLQDALAGAPMGEDQSKLIDRVCQLSETPVHVVMVPRNRVTNIPSSATRRDLSRIAHQTDHAACVVHDTHRWHIIGLAPIDELLFRDDWDTVGEHLQPAATVSPHDTAASAINQMHSQGGKMAVVTDQRGQMLGIITLKDLLGDVVGELAIGD